MSADTRKTWIRRTTILLTIMAFAGSYMHGVTWVSEHWSTPIVHPDVTSNPWPFIIAALPEVVIILCILKGLDDPRDWRVWVFGSTAVGWTLWTNGAAAGGGVSGMFVALAPAVVALMALFLQDHEPEPEPATVTVTTLRPPRERRPVTAAGTDRKAITERADGDLLAVGIAWVKAQPDYRTTLPSRPEIMAATGCSNSTAKRVRAAVREELDAS